MVPNYHPFPHQCYGNLAVYITYFNINNTSSNLNKVCLSLRHELNHVSGAG